MSKARGLADLGNVYNDGALSNRNLVINGAMQVAQRGTSFASWTGTSAYCLDRWKYTNYQSGAVTISQDIDAPSGFSNSLKISTTSTDAGPSTYSFLQQLIAGQDVASLAYGSATPKQVTVSFWVKSNMTGVYTFNIATQTSGRRVASTYTVTSANTWEYKTVTFDGDSASTIVYNSTLGFICEWWFAAGSNFTSSPLPTAWSAMTNTARSTGITVGINASTSNYVNITGVQLEVGDTATPFEHRSYGQELALCQRYFQELCPKTGTNEAVATGSFYSTTGFYAPVTLPVEMRADPTGTVFNQSSFKVFVAGAAITTSPVTLSTSSHRKAVEIEAVTAVNTAGRSGFLRTSGVPVPSIQLDAEL